MRRLCIAMTILGAAFPAWAAPFEQRLEKGIGQMKRGELDAALLTFQDLKIEDPESDVLRYSIGAARYQQGTTEGTAPEDAATAFTDANANFGDLLTSEDKFIRENAQYNSANCLAQIAKLSVQGGDQEKTVKAFEDAIAAYDDVLRVQPGRIAAKKNLDHLRFLLKDMLQNPPPPQEQPQDQQGEGEKSDKPQEPKDGGQDQQQQGGDESPEKDKPKEGEQQQGEKSDPPEDGEQPGEEKKEPAKTPEDKLDDVQQESKPDPQPSEAEPADGEAKDGQQAQADEPTLDKKNIEAILQSLEEQNREEQKGRFQSPRGRPKRNWW